MKLNVKNEAQTGLKCVLRQERWIIARSHRVDPELEMNIT